MAYEISTTTEIAATPENVWAVLADLASYPNWHPMYLGVTGQLAAGSTLTITSTHPATGRTMTAKVKVRTADPDTELQWVSKPLGVTISKRTFRLSPTAGGVWAGSSGVEGVDDVGVFCVYDAALEFEGGGEFLGLGGPFHG